MQKPLISIIICCYNRGHMLDRTLESVFAQDYEPVEIIAVDDGSTDHTQDVVTKHERIKYIRQENQGVAVARNTGCRVAKGEYIAFQDDDDIMPSNRITLLYNELSRHPEASFAMGDWAFIDQDGKLTGVKTDFKAKLNITENKPYLIEDGYKAVISGLVTPSPHTTLFRRKDGESIGWFDTRFFHSCEDTDFFARCAYLGPVIYIPEILSFYRKSNNSLCCNENSILVEFSRLLLFEKHIVSLKENCGGPVNIIQGRLLNVLKRIAYLKKNIKILPESAPKNYLTRGLSLLNITGRLSYITYVTAGLPIRQLIHGLK